MTKNENILAESSKCSSAFGSSPFSCRMVGTPVKRRTSEEAGAQPHEDWITGCFSLQKAGTYMDINCEKALFESPGEMNA